MVTRASSQGDLSALTSFLVATPVFSPLTVTAAPILLSTRPMRSSLASSSTKSLSSGLLSHGNASSRRLSLGTNLLISGSAPHAWYSGATGSFGASAAGGQTTNRSWSFLNKGLSLASTSEGPQMTISKSSTRIDTQILT